MLPDDHPGRYDPAGQRLPRGFAWFAVGAFLMIYGSQPMYSWSVPYLEESLGADPALSGVLVGMGTAVGAGVMILSGLAVDRAGPRRRIPTRRDVRARHPAPRVALILAGGTLGLGVAVLGVVGGISMQLACIGAMQAAFVDRAGRAVAQATALTMTGYYAGAVAAPTTFGAVVDTVGSYSVAWLIGCVLLAGRRRGVPPGGTHPRPALERRPRPGTVPPPARSAPPTSPDYRFPAPGVRIGGRLGCRG